MQFKSGNTSLVKSLNKQHILNLVRLKSGIAAREISDQTNLQMSTVLYTLRSLQDEGLVKTTGLGDSTLKGGKPPVLWELSSDYGYIIGVEFLSKEVRIVILKLGGEIFFKKTYPYKFSKDNSVMLEELIKGIESSIQESKILLSDVLGIGIGLPGSISSEEGIAKYSYALHFESVNIKNVLQEKFGTQLKIEIDNDANAGALGIKWLSDIGSNYGHILYVSMHQMFSGMGVGFIINHEIYRGAHSAAGEGKLIMPETKWRRIIKSAALKFPLAETGFSDKYNNFHSTLSFAEKGDEAAIYILKEVSKEISQNLIDIINLFDPEIVIIGGDICEAEKFIKSSIFDRVSKGIISNIVRDIPIKFSSFGSYSGAVGGAALIYRNIFSQN